MTEEVYWRCLAHARKVLPPDPALEPEDLVHTAFVKVGNRLDTNRSENEQAAYLKLIIGQLAIDRCRVYARHPHLPLEDWCPSPRDPEAEAIARVELAAILAVVPPFLLLYACGYLWREIAAACGVPLNTIKVQAWRFREARA